MSALVYTLSDSLTMSRRNLVHAMRYPIIAYLIALPVIFLLLFVYVLGGTLGAGFPPATRRRTSSTSCPACCCSRSRAVRPVRRSRCRRT